MTLITHHLFWLKPVPSIGNRIFRQSEGQAAQVRLDQRSDQP